MYTLALCGIVLAFSHGASWPLGFKADQQTNFMNWVNRLLRRLTWFISTQFIPTRFIRIWYAVMSIEQDWLIKNELISKKVYRGLQQLIIPTPFFNPKSTLAIVVKAVFTIWHWCHNQMGYTNIEFMLFAKVIKVRYIVASRVFASIYWLSCITFVCVSVY